jgi:hypothetical protein
VPDAAPVPEPVVPDAAAEPYTELAVKNTCGGNATHRSVSMGGTLEECAESCRTTAQCKFFLRDPNDGECRTQTTPDGNCETPYSGSRWYTLYELNRGF